MGEFSEDITSPSSHLMDNGQGRDPPTYEGRDPPTYEEATGPDAAKYSLPFASTFSFYRKLVRQATNTVPLEEEGSEEWFRKNTCFVIGCVVCLLWLAIVLIIFIKGSVT